MLYFPLEGSQEKPELLGNMSNSSHITSAQTGVEAPLLYNPVYKELQFLVLKDMSNKGDPQVGAASLGLFSVRLLSYSPLKPWPYSPPSSPSPPSHSPPSSSSPSSSPSPPSPHSPSSSPSPP